MLQGAHETVWKLKAREAKELEKLYNAYKLTPTGKTYTGYMKGDGSFQQNQEFEYGGKKYVRVILNKSEFGVFELYFKDKTIHLKLKHQTCHHKHS